MDEDDELRDKIASIVQDALDQHGIDSYGAANRIMRVIEDRDRERDFENYRSTVLDLETRG